MLMGLFGPEFPQPVVFRSQQLLRTWARHQDRGRHSVVRTWSLLVRRLMRRGAEAMDTFSGPVLFRSFWYLDTSKLVYFHEPALFYNASL